MQQHLPEAEHQNFAAPLAHTLILPLSHTFLFILPLSLTVFYLFSPLFLLPSLIDMNRKLISGILPALPIFVAYFCAPLRTLQSCRKGISQLHMMITLNMTLYTAAHTPPPHTHTHLKNCQSLQKLSHKSRAVSRSLPSSLSLSFCAGGSVIDEHFTFVISVFKLTECWRQGRFGPPLSPAHL